MKAMSFSAPAPVERRPLQLSESPAPEPGPGQVLVRVTACGVCRTDLHIIEGELPPRKSPLVPGHQVVGTVEKLGPEVEGFEIGAESASRGCTGHAVAVPSANVAARISASPLSSTATT